MDVSGVLILGVLLAMLLSWPIAIFDAQRWPMEYWDWAGRSRATWTLRLLLLGGVASVFYWLSVRPQLRAAKREGVPVAQKIRTPRRQADWGDPFKDG